MLEDRSEGEAGSQLFWRITVFWHMFIILTAGLFPDISFKHTLTICFPSMLSSFDFTTCLHLSVSPLDSGQIVCVSFVYKELYDSQIRENM